jgi:PAS domain S-box-containing protein
MASKPTYEELEKQIQKLEEGQEQLNSLLQSIQAAVVVHGHDTQIIACNIMAQDLLGLTKEQLLGKKTIDSSWKFFMDDGREMPFEHYPVNRVMTNGTALKDVIVGIYRPDKKDVVDVLVNAIPEVDSHGNIFRVIVTFMDITERRKSEDTIRLERDKLKEALAEIRTLREILPICSYCKKIRDDRGYWNQIESYISHHTETNFSHGICPACIQEHFPDMDTGSDNTQ